MRLFVGKWLPSYGKILFRKAICTVPARNLILIDSGEFSWHWAVVSKGFAKGTMFSRYK